MKRIIYRPKTVEQAKAAISLAGSTGYFNGKKWSFESQDNADFVKWVVECGMEFRDNTAFANPALFNDPKYSTQEASTLDELLAALSKPEKEPKDAGYIDSGYGAPDGISKRVWLLPDGSIKVGCSVVSREDFDRIQSEWHNYNGLSRVYGEVKE